VSRPLVAVGVVVFRGEKVLLVRRKHPPNQDRWAIPGGKVEFGETLRDALRREMKEETNLDVEPRVLMAVVEVLAEGYHYVILDFLCEEIGGSLTPSSDAKEAKFLSTEEWRSLDLSPTTREMLERFFRGEKIPLFLTEISTG
jgi:8-oxo-dGTP diphosphatase